MAIKNINQQRPQLQKLKKKEIEIEKEMKKLSQRYYVVVIFTNKWINADIQIVKVQRINNRRGKRS